MEFTRKRGKEKFNLTLGVRVDKNTRYELGILSNKFNVSISTIARQMIEFYIKNNTTKQGEIK